MEMTRLEKVRRIKLKREREKRRSRKHLFNFTKFTFKKFQATDHHTRYYEILDRFAKGDIPKLIISMPPQTGKSEGSTRRLPAFILGQNPDTKVALASYNTTKARKFNRDVQRIIDTKEYHKVFPETYLNESNVVTVSSNYLRNADEFEVVNKEGGVKAVGRGGALTGDPVDVMIMDDLYKDYAEGNSPVVREAVWDWYISVVKTRLHNDSQQLIVFTRWHEDDLIGRLEKKEPVVEVDSFEDIENVPKVAWVKINFQALMAKEKTKLDPRERGEALWPKKHSKDKLEADRALDPERFNCLHQGNPISQEGLRYTKFGTYTELPQVKSRKNYTDTADTGIDYLLSVNYSEPLSSIDPHIYVTDLYYSQESMETTEPATIELLQRGDIKISDIESNNGGRGFSRVVQKGVGDRNIKVRWFHQGENKESRINTNHAIVNRRIVFPSDWPTRWPEFYDHVTNYKKLFKANKFDDVADVLTGIIEKSDKSNRRRGVRQNN